MSSAVAENWEVLMPGTGNNSVLELEDQDASSAGYVDITSTEGEGQNDREELGDDDSNIVLIEKACATPPSVEKKMFHSMSFPVLPSVCVNDDEDEFSYVVEVGNEDETSFTMVPPSTSNAISDNAAGAGGAPLSSADDASALSSFTWVSSAPSASARLSPGFSFRDAILSNQPSSVQQTSGGDKALQHQDARSAASGTPPRRRRPKTRFVVKPIRRSSKSTGDLQSLVIHEEEEAGFGAYDAQEYYSQKAIGAKERMNGLKLRPDEARRRDGAVEKKRQQREKTRTVARKNKQ